jgi:hypothetical protein
MQYGPMVPVKVGSTYVHDLVRVDVMKLVMVLLELSPVDVVGEELVATLVLPGCTVEVAIVLASSVVLMVVLCAVLCVDDDGSLLLEVLEGGGGNWQAPGVPSRLRPQPQLQARFMSQVSGPKP